jgi:hypothetical protein
VPVSAFAGVVALAAAAAFGFTASRCWRGIERALVAVVLAYIGLATVLSWVGGIGALSHRGVLRLPGGALITAAALLVAAAAVWRCVPRARQGAGERWARPRRWEAAAVTTAATVLTLSVVSHAIRPPAGFDALSYHLPMGIALFHEGTLTAPVSFVHAQWLAGQPPGNFPLSYPGAAESVDGLLLGSLGEHSVWLPQTVAAVVLALAIGRLAVSLRGRPWLPVAAVLGCPLVIFQAPSAYNDLVAVACIAVAVVLLTSSDATRGRLLVAAIALGGAVATKTVMLPVAVALLAIVGVRAGVRAQRAAPVLLIMAVAFLLPVAAWWARDTAMFRNPLFPVALSLGPVHLEGLPTSSYGLAAQQLNFVPTPLAWPAYPVFEKFSDTSGFGAVFLVVAVPALLLSTLRPCLRNTWVWRAWLVATLVSLAAAVAFPLPTPRFQLLPVMLTCAFCGLITQLWSSYQRVVVVLAVAAVLITAAVAVDRLRPTFAAPIDRASFYAAVGYVEPPVSRLGAGARIWDDVSWSDYAFAAVYGLSGSHQDQRVFVGALGGRTPLQACEALPASIDDVYVVADAEIPSTQVTATYAEPMFMPLFTISRLGPHGVQRRSLFAVTPTCQRLSGS